MTLLGVLVAAQLAITVHAPDTVTVGAPATITVEASASGGRPPRIAAPVVGRDVSLDLSGRGVRVGASMGSRWYLVEQQYRVVVHRVGAVVIDPFKAETRGATTSSAPIRIVARAAPAPPPPPAVVAEARLDTQQGVLLRAAVAPETVYVGQQATYQVAVFLDDDVRLRLRRNPEFVPPEPRGMLAYDLQPPASSPGVRIVNGKRYEAHVFQRAIFPLDAGRYVIPPAQLVYSLPLSASFFSREESHTVRADSVPVIALEPPAGGRPADWLGAVGDFTVEARVDSGTGRAGDPVVVTLRVAGRGNMKLLPRPPLDVPWGTAVPTDERVRLDTASVVVRGAKEFDWLVTPRDSGSFELPAIRYPYFNPYTERYEIAIAPARPLVVAGGATPSPDTAVAAADTTPVLSLRPTLRAPVGDPVHRSPVFWAIALAAPLPAAVVGAARRPRRRRRPRQSPAARLRALGRSRGSLDAAALRRVYVAALAERIDLTPGAITTTRGALSHALRRSGVTSDVAHAAESLLVALDHAAYSPGAPPPEGAAKSAASLYARVDAEARTREALAARAAGRTSARVGPLVVLVALSLGALAATGSARAAHGGATEEPPATTFARARAAYRAHDFAAARDLFASVAERVPRAPDAWANFGTAAWQHGDTLAAVVGWQRALRLEPLAEDARDRLAFASPSPEGPIASVPRLPLDPVAIASLAGWCLAWGALAAAAGRGRRSSTFARFGAACLCAAVVGAFASRELDERLAARSLAAVDGHAALRTLPTVASEPGASLSPGDIARVVRREGIWARVQLDGDREGWVEWSRLTPLAP